MSLSMLRGAIPAAILATCCAGFSGCREDDSAPVPDEQAVVDGHTRMQALLTDISRRTRDEHPFLGTRGLILAEQNLSIAESSPSTGTQQLVQAHGQVAEELLKAGRPAESVQQMQAALVLLRQDPANRRLLAHAEYRTGIAALRLGETANCVNCTNGAACLLPIRDEGLHTDPTGSRMAIEHLEAALQADPGNLSAIWLLNVAHMTLGSYPEGIPEKLRIPPDAFIDDADDVRPFRNIAHSLGMATRNPAGGVIIDDFDGDDYLDILTSTWDPAGPIHLFHNNRDGTFEERMEAAGLDGLFGGLNMVQADYDNDGDVDVLVLRGAWLEEAGRHPNSLLQNDGSARFRDVTFDVGLGDVNYPTQTAAWGDYDNDGDLDLYVGNEMYPSQLFENDGHGRFRDVADRAGVQNGRLAKAVVWGDYDQDRWPDLYVSNLPGANRLYHNNRDGTFTDVAAELKVTQPHYSFPAWFWDYDNDGRLDLYVSSYVPGIESIAADYLGHPYAAQSNCLYHATRDGFEEVATTSGLTRPAQPMGANFGDVNNDGFLDFYLGTGYVDYEGLMPNLLYVNRGGDHFEDATFSARLGHLQKGHGIAFGDLDNDGDLDIFAQLGGWFAGDAFPNAMFENPGGDESWINVRLVGTRSNTSAIGARIHVILGDDAHSREIFRWVNSGGSFGANPLCQHIGLADAGRIDTLEVYWPSSDETQVFQNVDVNQQIEVIEGRSGYQGLQLQRLEFAAPAEQ